MELVDPKAGEKGGVPRLTLLTESADFGPFDCDIGKTMTANIAESSGTLLDPFVEMHKVMLK